VKLRLECQQLKAELVDALLRSRPGPGDRPLSLSSRIGPGETEIMAELEDLNSAVLERVNSFKMAVATDQSATQQAVMRRYKPQMEKLLGQIYAHRQYLPLETVVEQFGVASDRIDQEITGIKVQIRSEHERNDLLQREAKQLADDLAVQQKEVDQLRKQNQRRKTSNVLLRDIANQEIAQRNQEYQKLLEITSDEGSVPTSARAMIVTTGKENRKIRRTPSGKLFVRKDAAMPQVKPIEEFIAAQRSWLQEKIIRLRTVVE
jgi:hypothetical protein